MRTIWFGMMVIGFMACSSDKDKGGGGGGSSPTEETDGGEDATDGEEETPEVVEGNDGKLQFVVPNTNDLITLNGETFEIDVSFGDVAPTARWGLYYTANEGSFLGGIAIIEDLPITTTGVPWDVNFVEPGTYYLYGMLTDSSVTTVHFAPGSFKIEGEATGNHPPSVSLASPAGDQIYAPGTDIAITFTGSDKDEDPFTFKLEFTSDGSNWTTIAEDLASDENQYIWAIPGDAAQTARYQVRVTADDGKNAATAETPKPFGVTDVTHTFTSHMADLFAGKCAYSGCHVLEGITPPKSDLDLTTYNNNGDFMGASSKKEAILSRTRPGGGMPQANAPMGDLTDAERDVIQFWYWQGATN